jgi:hypothetical protein
LADLLEGAIHDFTTEADPGRLESASVAVLSAATAAGSLILELAAFARGIDQLARLVSTTESP